MATWDERFEFLLSERFPGYVEKVRTKIDQALRQARRPSVAKRFISEHDALQTDTLIESIIEDSAGWDLRGCSISRPSRKLTPDDEADDLACVVFLRTWILEARAYAKQLDEMDWLEFEELYSDRFLAAQRREDERQLRLDKDRFFNSPSANCDFDFWKKIDAWTPEEAVALSLGKDPAQVNPKSLKKEPAGSPFVRDFEARLNLANRAVATGGLTPLISPSDFARWAANKALDVPTKLSNLDETARADPDEMQQNIAALKAELSRLEDLVQSQAAIITTLRSSTDDMNAKSRTALIKLTLGLVRRYQFTPAGKVNYKGLHSVLQEHPTLNLSDGAIRNCIDNALKTLDITELKLV